MFQVNNPPFAFIQKMCLTKYVIKKKVFVTFLTSNCE